MGTAEGLPEGTVAFLFTDLEGSTRLLEAHPAAYREAVARHHALLLEAVEAHGGVVFETVGDAVYAAFRRPTDAVRAALAGQRALQAQDWGAAPLRARMGLHHGEVDLQGQHYFGAPLYRCARLTAAAHGGQVVLSGVMAELVRDALPEDAGLRDLGEHRLKDLQRPEHLFQLGHPDLPADFPPLRTLDARPHNLPLQLTSFVGRERELAAVAALLGAHRLVTLTGPGGTGKTRLALQAVADALEAYPDGVWLAELAALADPGLVPQAVAVAVGVREEPGRPLASTLAEALKPKRLLLVLDNCEHLLDACARLVDPLLRGCPRVTVLATGREALGIAGETAWRVPSLALPDLEEAQRPASVAALAQSEAVRLFVDRAVAVQPAFRVTPQSAPAVAQICHRLDGIPLAIELAAARVRVLPPEQLLARLEDRFQLLTGGSRTALERHQTLQAAVDWSYDLLTASEKRLFARLAVFAGGWTLEAAEHVGGGGGIESWEVLDLLTHLVDKSLAVAEAQPDGTARYRLLETLRQYGRAKLAASGEHASVRDRHLAAFLELAERADPALRGPDYRAWTERLDAEHDNLRAALEWSLRPDAPPVAVEAALRLVGALAFFWFFRVHRREGQAWLERALAAAPAVPAPPAAVRAKALAAAGSVYWGVSGADQHRASSLLTQSATLYGQLGDRAGEAGALAMLGLYAFARREFARARASLDQGVALARAAGDPVALGMVLAQAAFCGDAVYEETAQLRLATEALAVAGGVGDALAVAMAQRVLGRIALGRGEYARARAAFSGALAISRAMKNTDATIGALTFLGQVALREGKPEEAEARYGEALALMGDGWYSRQMVAGTRNRLAEVALARGDLAAARAHARASLAEWRNVTNPTMLAEALEALATVATKDGDGARALRLAGAAAAQRATTGSARQADDPARLGNVLQQAREGLGDAAAVVAWAEGQAIPLEQAVAAALEGDSGEG